MKITLEFDTVAELEEYLRLFTDAQSGTHQAINNRLTQLEKNMSTFQSDINKTLQETKDAIDALDAQADAAIKILQDKIAALEAAGTPSGSVVLTAAEAAEILASATSLKARVTGVVLGDGATQA